MNICLKKKRKKDIHWVNKLLYQTLAELSQLIWPDSQESQVLVPALPVCMMTSSE